MSSTLVLIALMVSLSVAVVFPELQYSKVNKSISNEYQFMVEKQRKGFITLGLVAISSFFIALQTDLDTPGNNARAWANPIVRDSFNERSNILLSPSSSLSAKYNTLAIKI